jgi:hypothetical protein
MGNAIATEKAELVFNDGDCTPITLSLSGLGVQDVQIGGSPVLNEDLNLMVTFKPVSGASEQSTPAKFTFTGSESVKAGKQGVLREGDESSAVMVSWPSSGPPIIMQVKCKIQSAGQDSVKAG